MSRLPSNNVPPKKRMAQGFWSTCVYKYVLEVFGLIEQKNGEARLMRRNKKKSILIQTEGCRGIGWPDGIRRKMCIIYSVCVIRIYTQFTRIFYNIGNNHGI